MDQQSISRINELARLAKTRALTSEESAERERLRKAYIAAFREQTRRTLDETRREIRGRHPQEPARTFGRAKEPAGAKTLICRPFARLTR